jgi:DUF1009 family protein
MNRPALLETSSDTRRVGLLAGWGRYPVIVAEALLAQGYSVHCLGLKDNADPVLRDICHDFGWVGMAQLGRTIRYFRRQRCTQITMAGKIHKVQFFQPWVWFKHIPDWRAVKCYYPHFVLTTKDRKDDTLLIAAIAELAKDGISVAPATDFAPELLVKEGQLTRRAPTAAQQADIEFGWHLAKEMGRLDIGQSVAVKGRAVFAVEAIEGTDACIRRAGQLCRSGGFTVVKTAKPQQDMRFDVPTIGLGTLETMVQSGATTLAIEAGKTILLDEAAVLDFANKHGLVIVSIRDAESMRAVA